MVDAVKVRYGDCALGIAPTHKAYVVVQQRKVL